MVTGGVPGPPGPRATGCDAVDPLLGAFALDSLEPVETAWVARHLAGCGRCRAEERVLRTAAAQLGSLVPDVPPPPGLRGRVLAAARRDPAPAPAEASRVPSGAAARVGSRWWVQPRQAWAVAVAAAVLAVAAGGWGIAEHVQGRASLGPVATPPALSGIAGLLSGGATVVALRPTAVAAPGDRAALVTDRAGRRAYLVVTGVRPVAGPRVYMLWYIRRGASGPRPVPIAAMTRAGVFRMPRTASGFAEVAITLEPHRHDRRPRGPVLLEAALA